MASRGEQGLAAGCLMASCGEARADWRRESGLLAGTVQGRTLVDNAVRLEQCSDPSS